MSFYFLIAHKDTYPLQLCTPEEHMRADSENMSPAYLSYVSCTHLWDPFTFRPFSVSILSCAMCAQDSNGSDMVRQNTST